jgi:hypothetical protein
MFQLEGVRGYFNSLVPQGSPQSQGLSPVPVAMQQQTPPPQQSDPQPQQQTSSASSNRGLTAMTTYLSPSVSTSNTSSASTSKQNTVMQLPTGITAIIPQTGKPVSNTIAYVCATVHSTCTSTCSS